MKFAALSKTLTASASLLVAAAIGFGCARTGSVSNEIARDSKILSAAAVLESDDTPVLKAERLAEIAELLFNNGGFDQTKDVTDVALALDSTNLRAGFLSAVLKPFMASRSIFVRIAPLMAKAAVVQPKLGAIYQNMVVGGEHKGFEKMFYETGDMDFSDSGPATDTLGKVSYMVLKYDLKKPGFAIRTEAELQTALDKSYRGFDEMRLFAKAHKDDKITISATTLLIPDLIQRYAAACEIVEDVKLVYELKCPPDSERNSISLNRADFELLGDMASYYQVGLALATSYDATQALQIHSIEDLLKTPAFGTLRKNSRLAQLNGLGLDIVSGMNWAKANQSTLCALGTDAARNRPGALFNEGFCVAALDPLLDMASLAVSGKSVGVDVQGSDKKVEMNIFALMNNAPKDLRSLGFSNFNTCGIPLTIAEKTVSGLFADPTFDINSVLKVQAGGAGCQ